MKYYVKNKVVNDDLCYLNLVGGSELTLLNNDEPVNNIYQCTFTMEELIAIEKQFSITIVENDNWELEEVN